MIFIGEIAAISAAVLWSFNAIALTEATKRIGAILINVSRMFLASIFLLITALAIGADFSISQSQFINLILSGLIGLIIGDTALFKAFDLIGPRIGMLLMSFAPPISALLAFIFLGEVITIFAITGILITVLGVTLVVLDKKQSKLNEKGINPKGIIFGLIGAVGQATGLIFAKLAFNESHLDEFVVSFIRLFFSTIIMFSIFRFTGNLKNPIRKIIKDKIVLKNTILASILGPYLGISASMIAISHTYVGIASTLMSTVPIIMLPISKFYYKEDLSWKAVLGAIIAVIGVSLLFV